MNMRNATCVRTQTSKDPTRVAILFISYSMTQADFHLQIEGELNWYVRPSGESIKDRKCIKPVGFSVS